MAGNEPDTHLSGTEARAGQKLGVMRYVLAISLALVVIAFLIILVVAGVGTLLWMVMQQNRKKPQLPSNMR